MYTLSEVLQRISDEEKDGGVVGWHRGITKKLGDLNGDLQRLHTFVVAPRRVQCLTQLRHVVLVVFLRQFDVVVFERLLLQSTKSLVVHVMVGDCLIRTIHNETLASGRHVTFVQRDFTCHLVVTSDALFEARLRKHYTITLRLTLHS